MLAITHNVRRYVTFAGPDHRGGAGVVFALAAHSFLLSDY